MMIPGHYRPVENESEKPGRKNRRKSLGKSLDTHKYQAPNIRRKAWTPTNIKPQTYADHNGLSGKAWMAEKPGHPQISSPQTYADHNGLSRRPIPASGPLRIEKQFLATLLVIPGKASNFKSTPTRENAGVSLCDLNIYRRMPRKIQDTDALDTGAFCRYIQVFCIGLLTHSC
jgi:hypothetical protein